MLNIPPHAQKILDDLGVRTDVWPVDPIERHIWMLLIVSAVEGGA